MKEQICINLRHLISIGTDFQNIKWYCIFIHQLFAQVDYPDKDGSGELRYCFHDFFDLQIRFKGDFFVFTFYRNLIAFFKIRVRCP